MWNLRPDRAVRVLTAVPLAKLFGGPDPKFHFALEFDRDTNAEEIDVRIGW